MDYSNPSNWDSTKLTLNNVNIPALWEEGRHKAEIQFLGHKDCDFFDMQPKNVTLLKPFGKGKVGVTSLDCEIVELDPDEDELAEPIGNI